MENAGDNDEEAEEKDLDSETTRDNVLAEVDVRLLFSFGEHATTLLAVSLNGGKGTELRDAPADCARKDSTSPVTKTFVSHLALMSEWFSPSVKRMIRPSTMYIDAAKSAGAKRRSKLWMI